MFHRVATLLHFFLASPNNQKEASSDCMSKTETAEWTPPTSSLVFSSFMVAA